METKYLKMNNNQRHLSLGNLCRIIKELSLNKTFANQTEIFYAIFGVDDVSDSTINNYCIGYRSIGTDFKQIYIKRKAYPNKEFDETMMSIASIIKGQIFNNKNHDEIVNILNDSIFKKLCLELYNLAKNDESIDIEFTKKINKLIQEEKIYDALCEFLIYIVLEKKQPIYVDKTQRELFENILNNTNISMSELEQFIKVQLNDGINYTYSIKKLAKEGNPYASFELGDLEYTGMMTGHPRYIKAYEYFKVAAEKNHPRANWLIAKMLLQGQIGSQTNEDYEKAYNYLKNAESLGSIAATNTLGIIYLNAIGKEKDIDKAIGYFEKAASENYVYAYNNLGKIAEENKDYEKAFKYYSFSADLEESWASNKLGEWYRKGIYVKKDMKKAYEYYKQALEVPKSILNYWAYFNLAKYFYLEGSYEAATEKNVEKAIEYFENTLPLIDASYEELIYIYISKYTENQKDEYLSKINEYLSVLSLKPYYKNCKEIIKKKLKEIEKEKLIIIKNI